MGSSVAGPAPDPPHAHSYAQDTSIKVSIVQNGEGPIW